MIWDTEHWANPCYTFPHSWTVLFYFLKTWPAYISLNLIPPGMMSKLLYFTNKKCMDVCNVWVYELNCPCTVGPHKGLHFDLPNKSLKQCLHDEVWLSNYNQQCHMGPAKLESNKKVHTITFTNISFQFTLTVNSTWHCVHWVSWLLYQITTFMLQNIFLFNRGCATK